MYKWGKGIGAGIIGGIVFLVVSWVFSFLPGVSDWYAQWFPMMMNISGMISMTISGFIMGLMMGFVYMVVNKGIPGKGWVKGFNFGFYAWLLGGLMWPVMLMGFAAAWMWIQELIFGFVTFAITGIVIFAVYGKK